MRVLLVVCVTLSLCLVGCGGGGQSAQSTTTTAPSTQANSLQLANGNWIVAISPKAPSQNVTEMTIGVAITSFGATWSSYSMGSSGCLPSPRGTMPTFAIFYTGPQTWNISGTYGAVSIDATLSGTATQITGTYLLHGGCAEGETGTITATLMPAITGTWKGQVNGTGPTVTLNITQQQSREYFVITGTATIDGSSCMTGGTISSTRSSLGGNQIGFDVIGTNVSVNVGGLLQPPTYDREILGLMGNAANNCPDLHGTITLTKQ